MERSSLKERLYVIIFGTTTPMGRLFDLVLLIAILLSVMAVMIETVPSLDAKYHTFLKWAEWFFTVIFTIEYILRIWIIDKPRRYIFSFYGIVDLIAVIPTYLSLIFVGTHTLVVIRALRLLRVFRILKLARYMGEGKQIVDALRASRAKITVFLLGLLALTVLMGTAMYLIEGGEHGFISIPKSIYWAIVTLTTVGYGDIAPTTVAGQFLASIIMILGYAIIAVPTGIVSAQMAHQNPTLQKQHKCMDCGETIHMTDAKFCRSCGAELIGES
jgi:voltage-gated potassium channel